MQQTQSSALHGMVQLTGQVINADDGYSLLAAYMLGSNTNKDGFILYYLQYIQHKTKQRT